MSRSKFTALCALLALGSLTLATAGEAPDAGARTRAERLLQQAAGERAAGRYGAERTLLRDAFIADPTWPLPLLEFHQGGLLRPEDRIAGEIIETARRTGDAVLTTCASALLDTRKRIPHPDSVAGRRTPAGSACLDLLRVLRQDGSPAQRVATMSRIRAAFPRSAIVLRMYLVVLRAAGEIERAALEGRRVYDASTDAIVRVHAIESAHALHKMGRHADAIAWEDAALRDAERAGPGAVADYWEVMQSHDARADGSADTRAVDHAAGMIRRVVDATLAVAPRLDQVGRAHALNVAASSARAVNDLERVADIDGRAAAVADSIGAPILAAEMSARRGHALMKLGRMFAAETALARAVIRARAVGELSVQRDAAHNLLHVWEARGDYERAVAAGAEFHRAAREEAHAPSEMMAHHDLAWLHLRNGHTGRAQKSFDAMVADIARMGGSYAYFAGEYYELIGDLERARDHYRMSLREFADRSRALGGMVRIAEALGDTSAALHYARISDIEVVWTYPEARALMPGVLSRLGRLDEARTALEEARSAARSRALWDPVANLTIELAGLQLRSAHPVHAAALADSAAHWAHMVGAHERELEARAVGAAARAMLHRDPMRVDGDYRDIVRRVSSLRSPQFSARVHQLRGDAFVFARSPERALSAYARATVDIDAVAERLDANFNRATYRAAQLDLSNRALGVIARTAGARAPERHAQWSLWRKGAPLSDGTGVLDAAARRLRPGQVLIDYAVLDTLVVALVVRTDRTSLRILPIRADTLNARIERMRAAIAPRVGNAVDRARVGFDAAAAHDLYRGLVEPILNAIGDRTNLIIVPDRHLHAVPFDALVPSRASSTYMIDQFTITYATTLDIAEPALVAPGRLVGIVPRASGGAGTVEELRALAQSGFEQTLITSDADAAAIRVDAQRAGVLHFATHGEANDREPQFARLMLGKGWLHAYEIADWKLPRTLVVLSACETGAGSIAGGEGALSLSRAFLRAGARGTIATLWPVGAPTAQLMRVFYAHYRLHGDAAAALRQARLSLRHGEHAQPFYWAPFTITMRGQS